MKLLYRFPRSPAGHHTDKGVDVYYQGNRSHEIIVYYGQAAEEMTLRYAVTPENTQTYAWGTWQFWATSRNEPGVYTYEVCVTRL